jgi:hypothetical protein
MTDISEWLHYRNWLNFHISLGDKCQITRGTWFYDGTWQPLSVEHADKLEEEHLGQFNGVSLSVFAQTNNGSSQQPDSPTKKNRPGIITHYY